MRKDYLKEEELKEEIKKSFLIKKPTERLKVMFVLLINNFLKSSKFNSYDEETKDIMRIKAYEFLSLYWKNYSEIKFNFYIDSSKEYIKKIAKINPKKVRENKDGTVKIGANPDEAVLLEEKLIKEDIKYKKEEIRPSAFAYFSQIVKSAFLQVIKNSNFNHIIKTDTNNGLNIIENSKDEKTYFDSANYLIQDGYSEMLPDNIIKKIADKYFSLKREKIEDNIVYDLHPLIALILEECDNFDDFIGILSFFYDEGEIPFKEIVSNPTIYLILEKVKGV